MRSLNKNWITEGLIDFEYKKYIMMSYLQFVEQRFSVKMLYPVLYELLEHFENLKGLELEMRFIEESFPKRISKIDFKNKKIGYEKTVLQNDWEAHLAEIVDLALSSFGEQIIIGNEIVKEIISKIKLDPVGIIPIFKKEGYIFVLFNRDSTVRIYRYKVSPIEVLDEEKQTTLELIGVETISLATTLKQIKHRILENNRENPNPAIYAMYCEEKIPLNEALLPIAKKLLRQQIAA